VLEAQEEAYGDAPKFLKALYKRYEGLTAQQKASVKTFFDAGKWKGSKQAWKETNSPSYG